jgi:colanic acid/amylovoran biosynthesis glycosyltransferase
MKTVIIYKEALLHFSETFIAEQAGALRTFRPKYVGLRRADPCLSFGGESLQLSTDPGRFAKWRVSLYRRMPIAPSFHHRVKRLEADLIHAHFAPDGAQVSALAARLHLPLVVTLHGADVTVRRDFAHHYGKLWARAALILCVSEFIRCKAIEAGFPPEKLRVHHIGIDLGKFSPAAIPRTPGLVLFVGRLVEKKGCEGLLRAMNIVRAVVPHVSLIVIGDGPLRSSLTALASSLGLSCQFLGARPAGEVLSWMHRASVFCVPSQTASDGDSEGLGMVFLEAQACKLPVVSNRHGGIPEAVKHGKTGLLVEEGDFRALSEALIRYLTNPGFAVEHGSAGRAWVESNFDLYKQTETLEQIYEEVLSGG